MNTSISTDAYRHYNLLSFNTRVAIMVDEIKLGALDFIKKTLVEEALLQKKWLTSLMSFKRILMLLLAINY